jgi:hypothetical protein
VCYMHAPKLDKAYKLRQNSHIADSVARSKVLTRPRLANYRVICKVVYACASFSAPF